MHRIDGNPRSGPDPGTEWWRGPTGAFPTVGQTSPDGAVTASGTPIDVESPTAPQSPVTASGLDQAATATPAAGQPPTRRRPAKKKIDNTKPARTAKGGTAKGGTAKTDSAKTDSAKTDSAKTDSAESAHTAKGDTAESARTAGVDDVAAAAGPGSDHLENGFLPHLDILGHEPEPVDEYDEPTDDVLGGRSAAPTGNGDEQDDRGHGHDGPADAVPGGAVPDVMVLPEHPRDRPTVVLPRGPVPGQSQPHDPIVTRDGSARTGSTRQEYRVGRGRPDAARLQAIEESTFWQRTDDVLETDSAPDADAEQVTAAPRRIGVPPSRRRRPRTPRTPFVGLAALVVAALVAAFFAWVSAEPIWLAVGHARTGTATVTGCTGSGFGRRCVGVFSDATVTSSPVALLGVDAADRHPGATVPARMVRTDGRQAFVGGSNLMVHLRWTIGVLLVLLCGLAIAGATGARRLESARARRRAVLLSLTGPLLLLAGFLYASY